jgi:putative integral membrane protein (TIGR02587 family)
MSGQERNQVFWVGLARAFGGAVIFSLPLLMTMEMWWLGLYMDRARLALLLVILIPLLVFLSHYIGFEPTFEPKDDIVDAFVAFAVGFIASVIVLTLFHIIQLGMPFEEVMGKVVLQAVPGSIGAMLARAQILGEQERQPSSYAGELFIMAAGALFLALNVAPTEEMILLAYHMTEWHAVALALASLLIMHAFVYAVDFHGGEAHPPDVSLSQLFLRFTMTGYAIVLLMSMFTLWLFGRADSVALPTLLMQAIVLAFPGAIGAAAARLIL